MKSRWRLFCLISLAMLLGCDGQDSAEWTQKVGAYEGLLMVPTNGAIPGVQFVTAILAKSAAANEFNLGVQTLQNNQPVSAGNLALSFPDSRTVHVTGSFASVTASDYTSVGQGCWTQTDSASGSTASFCTGLDWLKLSVTKGEALLFSLELTKVEDSQAPALETPQSYTVDEIVKYSKAHNFKTLIELQKTLQARDSATNAYLNLLPHINTTDILNILSNNVLTIAKSIGDLVPFLLPNRWATADQAIHQQALAEDSLRIVAADGTNVVEGLALMVVRDNLIVQRLQGEEDELIQIRNLLKMKEQAGLLQLGSSEDINAILEDVKESLVSLNAVRQVELQNLAHAAGFVNPDAITDVLPGWKYSISQPLQINHQEATQIALSRSIELHQMDLALKIAEISSIGGIFTFLDPSGDSRGGLGLGLPSYIAAGQDQVQEVKVRKSEMQSLVMGKVANTLVEMQESFDNYSNAVESVATQQHRVDRNKQNLNLGIGFAVNDLAAALTSQIKSQLSVITLEYQYYLSVSKINRALYFDVYDDLVPVVER